MDGWMDRKIDRERERERERERGEREIEKHTQTCSHSHAHSHERKHARTHPHTHPRTHPHTHTKTGRSLRPVISLPHYLGPGPSDRVDAPRRHRAGAARNRVVNAAGRDGRIPMPLRRVGMRAQEGAIPSRIPRRRSRCPSHTFSRRASRPCTNLRWDIGTSLCLLASHPSSFLSCPIFEYKLVARNRLKQTIHEFRK